MSKFEKKFGKYAIHNLTMVLIMCYVAGYVIELMGKAAGNNLLGFLTLDPYRILHGQVWRLVTWVIVPPESLDIFTIIMLFFYYSLGTALERTWGTYRYNVYIFSGMLFTIIGSFLHEYGSGFPGILQRFLCVQHVLYQPVDLPCLCCYVSGYAGVADVRDTGESKMDGNLGCGTDDLYRDRRKLIY